MNDLHGRTILITGAARRIGRFLALQAAQAGANLILHHSRSPKEADEVAEIARQMGSQVTVLAADFSSPQKTQDFLLQAFAASQVDVLINNAAIFEDLDWQTTDLAAWQRHLDINLTTPFLLSQAFAKALPVESRGCIINLLDWRALRPGPDHFPYTISKAGLVALTQSMAVGLAPRITVNGLALGAILPPADGGDHQNILKQVPAGRWAQLDEVWQAILFFLTGPTYITGEIIHLDGGRHLQ